APKPHHLAAPQSAASCVGVLVASSPSHAPFRHKEAWPHTPLPSGARQPYRPGPVVLRLSSSQASRQEQPPPLPDGDLGRHNGRRRAGSQPATSENVRAALRLGSPCRRGCRRRSATGAAANHSSGGGFLLFRGDHRVLSSGCIFLKRRRALLRNGGTPPPGGTTRTSAADGIGRGRVARFFPPTPFRHYCYCCRRISRHTACSRLRSGGGRGRRRGRHRSSLYRCRARRGKGLGVRMHDGRRRCCCAHLRLPAAPAPAEEAFRPVNPVLGGKRSHSRDGRERREAFARAGHAVGGFLAAAGSSAVGVAAVLTRWRQQARAPDAGGGGGAAGIVRVVLLADTGGVAAAAAAACSGRGSAPAGLPRREAVGTTANQVVVVVEAGNGYRRGPAAAATRSADSPDPAAAADAGLPVFAVDRLPVRHRRLLRGCVVPGRAAGAKGPRAAAREHRRGPAQVPLLPPGHDRRATPRLRLRRRVQEEPCRPRQRLRLRLRLAGVLVPVAVHAPPPPVLPVASPSTCPRLVLHGSARY
ncbi:unnamed protein product, partial [Ectocarpus sp. 8 AP-2014]